MRYTGKRWNNILILAIIAFAVILNLPTIIKTYLIEKPTVSATAFPTLFNRQYPVTALHTKAWSLMNKSGQWTISIPLTISADELIEHWLAIQGTVIDDATYQKLQSQLPLPQTVEVWYQDLEEPQRITYYQTPKFWLFKNWQNEWIAVTVETSYLFPDQKGS